MDETCGTLCRKILRIIEEQHPDAVPLENVRHLAGS